MTFTKEAQTQRCTLKVDSYYQHHHPQFPFKSKHKTKNKHNHLLASLYALLLCAKN